MIRTLKKERRPRDLLLLFEILSIGILYLYNRETEGLDSQMIYLAVGLIAIIYISNFVLGKITTGDNYIFLIVSMLMSIGIVTIFRINPAMGVKQLIWALAGILLFYLTYFIVKYLKNLERLGNLYIIGAVLLFALTLVLGKTQGGAKNWLKISENIVVQPSELTKILVIFILASFYSNYDKYTKYRYTPYIIMGLMYFFILMLFLQRDLGTAVIFLGLYMSIQFVYEKDRKSIFVNLFLLLIGTIVGYLGFNHVRVRVQIWRDPWSDPYTKASQIVQSLIAIAEGDFFGKGIGFGYPSQIPVSSSDCIFPVICEEMGIFTGIGIIMLYMILTYRGIKIALAQEYLFYRILAIAVSVLFCVQAFINIGGVIKLIPFTGLTLPFVSYGGSSMLSSFIALGILQVTSEDLSFKYEKGEGYDKE